MSMHVSGEKIEIPTREIEIYKLNLLEINQEDKEIIFEVSCSKGTYIRVLCEDVARRLGTVGYMKDLQRTKVDKFGIEDAVYLEQLNESHIISPENLCENYPRIDFNDRKLELFLNGVMLTVNIQNGIYKVYNKNVFIGLGIVKDNLIKRDVIF